jgi:hypothetical protein
MNRTMVVISLACLVFYGCGKAYRPPERGDSEAEAQKDASAAGKTAAAASDGPDAAATAENVEVRAGVIRLTAPASWVRGAPRSGFVAAEFQLPRAEGDERDGRLTVSVAGGSVQANVDRWRGQFGGSPEKEAQTEESIAGVTVTVVDYTGSFNDQMGPMAPGVQREGYRMMGAVVPVGGQLHFIKAYGPAGTIERHAESFRTFLQTLQVDAPSS